MSDHLSAAFLAVVRRSSIRVTANATNVAGSVTRVFLFPTHFKLGVMLQLFHSGLPNTPVVVHVTSELDTLLCAFASRACGNDSYTSILSLLHSPPCQSSNSTQSMSHLISTIDTLGLTYPNFLCRSPYSYNNFVCLFGPLTAHCCQ